MKKLLFAALITAALASCKKENPKPPVVNNDFVNGIWIVNEGNFSSGNASLDFFRRDKDSVENQVFQKKNNRPIGDILQSLAFSGDNVFMVVNNSSKIEVASRKDLSSVGVINGLTSPRYMLVVSPTKAYVTDLMAKGIWIVNPTDKTVTGKIAYRDKMDAFSASTEELTLASGDVFICAPSAGKVLVVNPVTDKITDSITVGANPQWIVTDKSNNVWALCNDQYRSGASELDKIDPVTHVVTKKYSFPNSSTAGPAELKLNGSLDSLYYIYKGINKMSVNEATLPSTILISTTFTPYGLGIDPSNGDIYLSESANATDPSIVYRYSNGKLNKTFKAGLFTGEFYFVQ